MYLTIRPLGLHQATRRLKEGTTHALVAGGDHIVFFFSSVLSLTFVVMKCFPSASPSFSPRKDGP